MRYHDSIQKGNRESNCQKLLIFQLFILTTFYVILIYNPLSQDKEVCRKGIFIMQENEMSMENVRLRESVIKQGIVTIVGMILAIIPIMGYYPLGAAYAIGVMTSRCYRLPCMLGMFAITLLHMDKVEGIKYGLILATIYALVRTLEGKGERLKIWQTAGIASVTVLFLEGTDAYMRVWTKEDGYILSGLVLLTISAGYVADIFIDYIVGGGKSYFNKRANDLRQSEGLKVYQERLKMIGGAFAKLADSSGKWEKEYEDDINIRDKGTTESIENKILREKIRSSRKLLNMYLSETSSIMKNMAKDMEKRCRNYEDIKGEIERELTNRGVFVREVQVIEEKGKRKIKIKIKNKHSGYITGNNVAKYISDVMGKAYVLSSGNNKIIDRKINTYLFEEDANYIALHGMAKRSMDGKVSGDSFSCMNLEGGQTLLSISDGMGTGIRANKDSERVIELIEEFMNCGFSEELTLKLINSIFINDEGGNPTTVDMSIIDMHSGVCDIVKSGAATTYVKRNGWVEAIKSTSLPIGVMESVDIETTKKKLYDGDFLIMMSDGLVESIEGEDKDDVISSIILEAKSKKPKELAMEILATVAGITEKDINDDMTVLVTGVWDKIA